MAQWPNIIPDITGSGRRNRYQRGRTPDFLSEEQEEAMALEPDLTSRAAPAGPARSAAPVMPAEPVDVSPSAVAQPAPAEPRSYNIPPLPYETPQQAAYTEELAQPRVRPPWYKQLAATALPGLAPVITPRVYEQAGRRADMAEAADAEASNIAAQGPMASQLAYREDYLIPQMEQTGRQRDDMNTWRNWQARQGVAQRGGQIIPTGDEYDTEKFGAPVDLPMYGTAPEGTQPQQVVYPSPEWETEQERQAGMIEITPELAAIAQSQGIDLPPNKYPKEALSFILSRGNTITNAESRTQMATQANSIKRARMELDRELATIVTAVRTQGLSDAMRKHVEMLEWRYRSDLQDAQMMAQFMPSAELEAQALQQGLDQLRQLYSVYATPYAPATPASPAAPSGPGGPGGPGTGATVDPNDPFAGANLPPL